MTDFYGLDIGDGETAVATVREGSQVEPQILSVRARKSIVTALGISEGGERFIGEEAFQVADIAQLHLRFKSLFLTQDASHRWLEDFARTLLETLQREGNLDDLEQARFFVGCPSGWHEEARAGYLRLLTRAGFRNTAVVSESRAALVYARESGELRVASQQLYRPTLIIDAGSSTTDYTYVSNLEEHQLSDSGEVALGAGILDSLLLEANIARQGDPGRLRALLDSQPALQTRCEMEARRVKERYFIAQRRGTARTYPCESSLRLYTDPPMRVDILCDDQIMNALLAKPVDALGGQSYLTAYRQSLVALRGRMQTPPEVILLTGGATHMAFMRDMAQEAFPDATIVQGNEPEYAIARGLCYALRLDAKRTAFTQDVQAMIQSDAVEAVVSEALKPLFAEIAPILVDQVVDGVVPAVFGRWRAGEIDTLNQMLARVGEEAALFLRSDALRELLRPVIAQWLNTLRPQLEEITNAICDRYGLPRTSLRLPDFVAFDTDIPLDPGQILNFDGIKILIDVVVAVLVAMLAGGTGTALVVSGPLGWLVGLVVGAITAWIGVEFAEKLVMDARIPRPMRAVMSRRLITGRLAGKKEEMTLALQSQLYEKVDSLSPDIVEMINTVAKSIEQQLQAEMEEAVLLIR